MRNFPVFIFSFLFLLTFFLPLSAKSESSATPGEIIKKIITSFNQKELDSLRSVFPNLMNLPGEPPTVLGPPPPIVVDQKMFQILDPIVEKLIAAYHAKNVKTFYDLFATSVSSISDPKIFRKNYLTPGFGKCLKRKIAPEKSSFFAPAPLIQYDAEFEKAGKVTVSVNFIREGKDYKVLRVNFEKTP